MKIDDYNKSNELHKSLIKIDEELKNEELIKNESAKKEKDDKKIEELMKIEDSTNPTEERIVEDPIFEGIETREDDDSSIEDEYKDDFEEDTGTMEKLGRLTLPKTKETLSDLIDLYKTQLMESQRIAEKTLYEGNLKVIEEDLCEMSSQEMSKKKEQFLAGSGL